MNDNKLSYKRKGELMKQIEEEQKKVSSIYIQQSDHSGLVRVHFCNKYTCRIPFRCGERKRNLNYHTFGSMYMVGIRIQYTLSKTHAACKPLGACVTIHKYQRYETDVPSPDSEPVCMNWESPFRRFLAHFR